MDKLLSVAPSPHLKSSTGVPGLMFGVVIAMMPVLVLSVIFYGLGAIVVTATAVASCVLFEAIIQKYVLRHKITVSDGSAVVTGILLAFNIPSDLPVFMIILGSLVSIGVGKLTFGGIGNNPFNPALVGRVFLLVSFPVDMTTYPNPTGLNASLAESYIDASSGATPLTLIKEGIKAGKPVSELMTQVPDYADLFFGDMGGSMGEIAGIAIVIGFLYMLVRKIITWHVPVVIVSTIFAFTGILWLINPEQNADPLFHILTGGVLLGAVYMATDYVTSPMTIKGQVIFAVGIAIITVVIRVYGAYPEGISFAILIMNAFVPLINRYVKPKRFGEQLSNG
ncbi:MAG: RnfABCDGE type electron transport complex subunit D [Bacteroidetes bacterium]|jgi:electron transport complex protein RnfD|nr:RnfABCDGE type electron transport complex subunit D [Bacteroidota bacterium]